MYMHVHVHACTCILCSAYIHVYAVVYIDLTVSHFTGMMSVIENGNLASGCTCTCTCKLI